MKMMSGIPELPLALAGTDNRAVAQFNTELRGRMNSA